jgi:hypothetical protein
LRALSLCTCCRHYPGAADGRTRRSKFTHPCQPSPIPLSGRPAHRPFRGLLGVHSRCGLHTRTVTKFVTAIRGLQTFRRLHACPGCFRLERSPGGACTRWKTPPYHGARGMRAFLSICRRRRIRLQAGYSWARRKERTYCNDGGRHGRRSRTREHQVEAAIARRDEALAQQATTTMKSSSASRQATI